VKQYFERTAEKTAYCTVGRKHKPGINITDAGFLGLLFRNDFHVVGREEAVRSVRTQALPPALVDQIYVRDYVVGIKGNFGGIS